MSAQTITLPKPKSIHLSPTLPFLSFLFLSGFLAASLLPLRFVDWQYTFYLAARIPLDPYQIPSFINPPWTALILFPLGLLPSPVGAAVNAGLCVAVFGYLVVRRRGGFLAFALVLTSFPFAAMVAYGNIEWIVALGFILANRWSLPLLMVKPQSGIFAAADWFLRAQNKIKFLLPALGLLILSFVTWDKWPLDLLANVRYVQTVGMDTWNISPFPWLAPIGVGLMIYILRRRPQNGELLGALATVCLVPYLSYQSLAVPFALFAIRYPRLAMVAWLALWVLPFWRG